MAMNYPTPVKKAFKKIHFSAVDIWQNLRTLKKEIQCLVRNIDNVGACVVRNRRLLQGIEMKCEAVKEDDEKQCASWTHTIAGDRL
ncbi:MAG TPA: hypothetical protein PLY93_06440 [Turneriella sp.]|nr:hypothetical protein [Turneriella sp.]